MADTKDPATADCRQKTEPGAAGLSDARDCKDTGSSRPVEIGGRKGPDPTRYGDWEKGGRCIDF